jgi:hypothetical protein
MDTVKLLPKNFDGYYHIFGIGMAADNFVSARKSVTRSEMELKVRK